MTTVLTTPETLAELLVQLGGVSADRILLRPPPGTATPADVLQLLESPRKRVCDLVDGVLVEKAMGHLESRLAMWLGYRLLSFLESHDLGIVAGADAPHRLGEDLVRFPDLAFIAYDRIPAGADPATPLPDWVPSLAVEILSPANTPAEMERKLRDYFAAGVELVWYADPRSRTVRVFTPADQCITLRDDDELDGGSVLPGFRLAIREWFDSVNRLRP